MSLYAKLLALFAVGALLGFGMCTVGAGSLNTSLSGLPGFLVAGGIMLFLGSSAGFVIALLLLIVESFRR